VATVVAVGVVGAEVAAGAGGVGEGSGGAGVGGVVSGDAVGVAVAAAGAGAGTEINVLAYNCGAYFARGWGVLRPQLLGSGACVESMVCVVDCTNSRSVDCGCSTSDCRIMCAL
jgi:hypothetical protein